MTDPIRVGPTWCQYCENDGYSCDPSCKGPCCVSLSPVHSDRLSEQELQDIRERCEKASAGPWAWAQTAEKGYGANVGADVFADEDELCDSPLSGNLTGQDGYDVGRSVCETFGQDAASNADFIAHARSDIPKLLSELSRLRSEQVTLARLNFATNSDEGFEAGFALARQVLTEEETGR